jgi:hypothetical protein
MFKKSELRIYTHHFSITCRDYALRSHLERFCSRLRQWGLVPERGQMVRKPLKDFASVTRDGVVWRFHIGIYKEFLTSLEYTRFLTAIDITQEPLYKPVKTTYEINPIYTDRDYQIPAIEFLSKPPDPNDDRVGLRSRLLRFRMGRGKSYTIMRAIQVVGERCLFMVRATYVDKWVADLKRTYVLEEDDICVVADGVVNIKKALKKAVEGKNDKVKIYVMSMDTHKSWLRLYESFGTDTLKMGFACLPHEMFKTLGVGVRGMDEVHQHFHACYREDLFTHVPLGIGLSATLLPQDFFLKQRQAEMFPPYVRYHDDAAVVYTYSESITYYFKKPEYIQTHERGSTQWSSNAFEASIIKHKPTLYRYLDMLAKVALASFGQVKRPKKRLLVLAYKVEMVDLIVERFRSAFPGLAVKRYVSGSPWEDLMESDISVSTYGKAGTAVDVADLTNLLVTINMGAEGGNIQISGRLRQLSDGHKVLMQCMVAGNIAKSVEFDRARQKALQGWIVEQKDVSFGSEI